jgi:hypothetical protein
VIRESKVCFYRGEEACDFESGEKSKGPTTRDLENTVCLYTGSFPLGLSQGKGR